MATATSINPPDPRDEAASDRSTLTHERPRHHHTTCLRGSSGRVVRLRGLAPRLAGPALRRHICFSLRRRDCRLERGPLLDQSIPLVPQFLQSFSDVNQAAARGSRLTRLLLNRPGHGQFPCPEWHSNANPRSPVSRRLSVAARDRGTGESQQNRKTCGHPCSRPAMRGTCRTLVSTGCMPLRQDGRVLLPLTTSHLPSSWPVGAIHLEGPTLRMNDEAQLWPQ